MRKSFPLIIAVILLSACSSLPKAQPIHPVTETPARSILVYYAGPEGRLRSALNLIPDAVLIDDPSQADVLVLNGVIPEPKLITQRVQSGIGLILILGPDTTSAQIGALLGTPIEITKRINPLSLTAAPGAQDRLLTEIIWTGAPQIRERYSISSEEPLPLQALVTGYEDNSLILGSGRVGNGQLYVFTPFIDEANPQFQDWAYFNYFFYFLVTKASGSTPLSFDQYPNSPVPHKKEQSFLILSMVVLVMLSLVAYWLVRRYSLAHPEALDALVADREKFEVREIGTQWEEIGFHRPLGGFLLALMIGFILFIPLIIYQNLILPVYILPSAQALGIWGRVVQFFNVAWLFFDMGTSTAMIKYLSEYRVYEPRQGIQYAQLFVWWQALSGTVQVAFVVILAGTVLPHTAYALYAWSIIIHSFIQIPGFYQVMRNALTALQRFDYAQILDVALNAILPMIAQPIFVLILYAWGGRHPSYGASMGGLFGLGVAAYAAEAMSFITGYWLYKRLGYNTRVLFLAHFDWNVIKNSFRFGVFEMLGSIASAAGSAAEILITQSRLINYAEIWGNWGLAQNFIFAFQVISTLFNNLMPSISEAISHGRKLLSQYYEVQAYKYGGIISALIGALLLAVADRFIIGASGPEFVRAATYSIPLIIWGAIQFPAWVGDNIQLAVNRPYLKFLLVTGEQTIRVVLAIFLIERFQIFGLILAYFVGLLIKDIFAYFVNNRLCFPHRFYFWQSLAAPLLAGVTQYLILRWVTGLIWRPEEMSSVLIFLLSIVLSFPLFAFFYGMYGGWDDETLLELRQAVELSSFMRPLSWLFWASTSLGARISPLHGRFPIEIRQAALLEAQTLTAEKVHLV